VVVESTANRGARGSVGLFIGSPLRLLGRLASTEEVILTIDS
jgi:hypothetical protein